MCVYYVDCCYYCFAATCDWKSIHTDIEKLKRILERVIMLELTTIPPYFTAWLSLKTEDGRNYEVARMLKSIVNEEMLHLALAANLLNSVCIYPFPFKQKLLFFEDLNRLSQHLSRRVT